MTIAFFSDVHQDAVTMGVRRFDEVGERVAAIRSYISTQNIRTVVFGGDWCDPTPEGWACLELALHFDQTMHRLGAQMLWMPGNHDVVEDGRGSSVLTPLRGYGATIVDKPAIHTSLVDGLRMGFLPFAPRALAYDPVDVVQQWGALPVGEQPQLIFGHLNLKDAHPGSETTEMPRGREVMWPLDALRQYLPNARLYGGHYHKGENVKGVEIVGSPALFTFGEEGNAPGFMRIERDGTHERLALAGGATFRTLQYDLDTGHLYYQGKKFARPKGPNDPAKKLFALVKGAFVRVQLTRDDAPIAAAIEQDLLECGARAVRIEVSTSEVQPAAPQAGVALATVSDGIAEAKRLAKEWATADGELKEAIIALVAQTAEDS